MRPYNRTNQKKETQNELKSANDCNVYSPKLGPRALQAYNDIVTRFGYDLENLSSAHAAAIEWGFKPHKEYDPTRSHTYYNQPFAFDNAAGMYKRFVREHRIRIACRIGLRYMAAAAHGNVDPAAYKVWQDISGHCKDNRKFDTCGVYGIAYKTIESAWYASGCKDNRKFRAILNSLNTFVESTVSKRHDQYCPPKFKKSMSAKQTVNMMRGWRFYQKRNHNFRFWMTSPKHFEILGRVSLPLRYAMVKGYENTKQLNFEFASEVQTWTKEKKSTLLSPKEAWHFLYKRCPFKGGKEAPTPHPKHLAGWKKSAGCFAKLVNQFGKDSGGNIQQEMLLPIFNLAAMFGSENEVEKYLKSTGKNLHDAGQFMLPIESFTASNWLGFVQRFPEALKYSQYFGKIEASGEMPKSLNDLRLTIGQFVYDNIGDDTELAAYCHTLGLTQSQFDDYQSLTAKAKTYECCPSVDITSGEYRIFKLAHDDVRGPLLGLYTDCCQHLEGAGAACARHGWIDPTSAFYAVEYKGKIVAQSWAWRSKMGDLVFDSIEGLRGYNTNTISELFLAAAKSIVGRLGISRVLVGKTSYGLTASIREYLVNNGEPCKNGLEEEMRSKCSYMDGRHQWLLTEKGQPVKFKKDDLCAVNASQTSENRLLDGSGVFCEHCEAEVHPSCEICPSCNENIAEWV